jgi:long-chain acyl-CoA synthetase
MVASDPGVSVSERDPRPGALEIKNGDPILTPPAERARNLVDLVWRTVERHPEREAVRWKADGAWHSRTYAELGDWIIRIALGLAAIGVKRGDHVALISGPRPEWLATDLAILSLGAVTCPIHPSEGAGQFEHMLTNLAPRVVVAERRQEAAKVEAIRDRCPSIERVVVMDPTSDDQVTLAQLADRVEPTDAARARWREEWERIVRDDVATIVHTSGSTGLPKGVVLTHGNIVHNCEAAAQAIPFTPDDVVMTMLPLSHMFARTAGMFAPLSLGMAVAFAEPLLERLPSNLLEVRPTVMLTVPPFFARIHKRVLDQVAARSPIQRRIFAWAAGLGPQRYENHLAGRPEGVWLRFQLWLAGKLVFDRIRALTGGRLRFFASGAAPLPREIGEFFYAMGMLILEGYGLSETAPFVSLNHEHSFKFGTVGYPFPETELAIDQATGEILARGPQVMRGYLNEPEETAKTIDADGWLHTGDIGRFDEDGRLLITDRIKNLIVLSTGKKVTPGPMQTALAASPYIAQSIILGDGQESPGALIAPNFEHLRAWAATEGIAADDDAALAARPEVRRLLETETRRLLKGFASWERPRRVAVLPRELSVELGELTAIGKPKRAVIEANWPDAIATLFGTPPSTEGGPR